MTNDVTWILEEAIKVTKDGDSYVVNELAGHHRQVIMYYDHDGRLRFNGTDIETEAYMAFVGLMEHVDEDPTGIVQFEAGE